MSTTESSATERTGTAEDVELLARFMGWEPAPFAGPHAWRTSPLMSGVRWLPDDWNPLVSADADVQVLERVREAEWGGVRLRGSVTAMDSFYSRLTRAWGDRDRVWMGGGCYLSGTSLSYTTGDFSRAALAVLKEMEKP